MSARWKLCWLLFAATALSFIDRQVLSVLAPVITREFHLSNALYSHIVFGFQLSYTAMFTLGGRIVDALGTRLGMALCLGIWSAASAAHSLARGAGDLFGARFLLGIGEGGSFPAATKGVAEWFSADRRALAMGIATGGSALGAVLAPPLTSFSASRLGWRGTFAVTGILGFIWLAIWLAVSRKAIPNTAPPGLPRASFRRLLKQPLILWILFARFLFDPVFYFYMFWIPQYLSRDRHLTVDQIGALLWIPFLVLGFSQVLGGRVSDLLVRKGWTPTTARTLVLAGAALLTPSSWLAALASNTNEAITLMCVLMFAHGFWITNFLGLIADLFPQTEIGTITGLTGTAGGIGGMLSTLAIGVMIDRYSFLPAFIVSGLLYPLAFFAIWTGLRYQRRLNEVVA